MSREKDFVINTAVLSLGKLLPNLIAFVVLPILTAYLTKAEMGTYDLITTIVMLAIPVASLQIQSAAFRFLIDFRKDQEESKNIISNIFAVVFPISIVAGFILQFFFARQTILIRVLIGTYLVLDTLCITIGQVARGLGNNKVFSVGAIIQSGVGMIVIVILVYGYRKGLLGVVIAMILAQLLGAVYMGWRIRLLSYFDFRKVNGATIRKMLAYSWPMVPNNLSAWVLKLSDRLVITGFLGLEANAVYVVANKIPNILSIGQSIIVMAWQENASIAARDKDASEYYSSMLDQIFRLMFGGTALLIAATPLLFKILIRGDYGEAYYQMPVLILAMFFYVMSSFFGGIYIAHKKTTNVGISTMVAAAINLAIDLAFVKVIGIWAGSVSTLAAYFLLYVYRAVNCQSFQPIKINFVKQSLMIVVLAALLISCFMQRMVLNIINVALALILTFAFNKDLIGKYANAGLKRVRSMMRRSK